MQSAIRPVPLYPDVERHFFYLEDNANSFFGWQHFPASSLVRQQSIILCQPFGHEYTHAHRSFKHLAEYLANQGFNVFRFDYHGTGDSPGSDMDENRIEVWISNICFLAQQIKHQYPDHQLSLIGLRLGATLAALATQQITVDHLILWEPIIKGSRYVREITALARLAANDSSEKKSWTESAGFIMTANTLADIKNIDLIEQKISVEDAVLFIRRSDRVYDRQDDDKLLVGDTAFTEIDLPGYADMIEEPQEAKVPFLAIQFIGDWLIGNLKSPLALAPIEPLKTASQKIAFTSSDQNNSVIEEVPCWYKNDDFLFGVISKLKDTSNPDLPAIVLLNSGSAHHVGPNRLYVDIARLLAAKGFCVLRIDLEGLGDSASAIPTQENHPYQPNAVANAFSAMDYLQNQQLTNSFVIAGICSGAHTAFHCALAERELLQQRIQTILLINPLTFYWKEGMSLSTRQDDTQTIRDKNLYKQSVRDPGKWLKLLRGKVSFRYLLQFFFSLIKFKTRALSNAIREIFSGNQNPLSIDFDKLIKRKVPVHFIFSSTDPGLDLIKRDAQQNFSKGISAQVFDLALIDKADHTFSQSSMRENLYHHLHSIFNRISKKSGNL